MTTLAIDIETYSSVDIKTAGVYRYAEADDFEILLFGYAVDDGPAQVIDLANGEELPGSIADAILDDRVTKAAFHALFERTCLSRHFGKRISPKSWECTLVMAARLGLPLHLDGVAKALRLPVQKDAEGKKCIKYFSVPCKPTIKNGGRRRNLARHDPALWQRFKIYCPNDVDVERAIRGRLSKFNVTETERRLYPLDQEINDRGMYVDLPLVTAAIQMDQESRAELEAEAMELTGLENPNSAAQLKTWLSKEIGEEIETLRKADIPVLLDKASEDATARVLSIRQEMAKTSVKKYEAMAATTGRESRIRGLYQFYGANRTGRWAGRLVQVQNLPQNHLKDLDLARRVVRSGDRDLLQMLYGNVPDTLSQLVRTAFVAAPGNKLIAADFAAIELIVLAWLAGERWVIDEFCGKRKIYEQTAARMLGVPVEAIGKGSPERQKGKIASLACQYGGGVNALISMGALRMGLQEDELQTIVGQWRAANPNTTKYWRNVEQATINAICLKEPQRVGNIIFTCTNGVLFIELPSGRRLAYVHPKMESGITYEGVNQYTKKWGAVKTWGGKLVENIVQAVARDCLAVALLRIGEAGYAIVGHVHDEIIVEVDENSDSLGDILKLMTEPIQWAKGLPLAAEGFEGSFYRK